MTTEENMTIEEIDRQMEELRRKRKILRRAQIKQFKIDSQKNVGRCFKINHRIFAKVIDVPQEDYTIEGYSFNEYQFPALFLTDNPILPFELDTLFSAAWGVGYNAAHDVYEEISHDEFMEEFNQRIELLRGRTMSCRNVVSYETNP